MTLIAGFMRNDCPILIGDILISNRLKLSTELTIPTIGKISPNNIKNGVYRPSAFSQKINLLSPQLALAWSGNLLEAKAFLAQVAGAKFHNNPSREAIIEIFNDLAPSNLCIIGLLRDGRNITLFDIGCEKIDISDASFKWFKAGGTGYRKLQTIIPEMSATPTSGTLNKLDFGVSVAAQIATSLLSLELQTGATLHELFGAGYEILHPLGNELVKFADFTYYFWNAEEWKSGNWRVSTPFLVMKYSYHKDILVIRSARLSQDTKKENATKVESDELHLIMPTYRMVDNNELIGYNPASLNSKNICNVFLCKDFNGELGSFSTFGRYSNATVPIIWTNEFSSSEGMDISLDFLRETIVKISSGFR